MRTGDIVKVKLNDEYKVKHIELMLDDRVLPDRTCGQYDTGFWAFDVTQDPDDDSNDPYFVSSDNSVVYCEDRLTATVTHACGEVVSVSTPKEEV